MNDNKSQVGLTRSQVAQRFGVSVSAVRTWQKNFKEWLEVEPQKFGGGRHKANIYTEHDMLVFATVRRLTKEGQNFAQIRERMDEELASATFEHVPDEQGDDEEQPGTALVPWQRYSIVVAQLQGTEGKLEAITDERDYLRERVDKVELRQDEERERFKEQIDKLEGELDEERQKSFWQRLIGR